MKSRAERFFFALKGMAHAIDRPGRLCCRKRDALLFATFFAPCPRALFFGFCRSMSVWALLPAWYGGGPVWRACCGPRRIWNLFVRAVFHVRSVCRHGPSRISAPGSSCLPWVRCRCTDVRRMFRKSGWSRKRGRMV